MQAYSRESGLTARRNCFEKYCVVLELLSKYCGNAQALKNPIFTTLASIEGNLL
jgi:hypothetical protein